MFWKKRHSKTSAADDLENNSEYEAQKKRLFETPLYEPNRQEVELPDDDDGLGSAAGIKNRRWGFKLFDGFEESIHRLHKDGEHYDIGPWRLEQQSDPYLFLFGIDDGPVIGLRFKVFYNSEKIGDLEINPSSERTIATEDIIVEPKATLEVSIYPAPFIPHHHLTGFLYACTEAWQGDGPARHLAVERALTGTLWESNREDSMWVHLYFSFSGIPWR